MEETAPPTNANMSSTDTHTHVMYTHADGTCRRGWDDDAAARATRAARASRASAYEIVYVNKLAMHLLCALDGKLDAMHATDAARRTCTRLTPL